MRLRLLKHFRELVVPSSRPLEFILAVQAILYGGWLLLPADTFNSAQAFSVMNSIAPEWLWGGAIFGVGAVQLFGLFTSEIMARRILGLLDLFLWLLVDLALWAASSASAAPIFIFTSVLAAILINLSLVVDGE